MRVAYLIKRVNSGSLIGEVQEANDRFWLSVLP